jgi:glycosyltransferase involved in cell wall biosynthesis
MKNPLISCIVPVFNGELYLGEALESIFRQTYRPLEIIVIDDGSTDGTPAVAARYKDVRYAKQANAGPAAARNTGIRETQGEFVAFLDADDLWHAEKLERQMARFQMRPQMGWCVTQVQHFWVPELKDEAARFHDHRLSQPVPGYVTGTLLARRAVFESVGLFNPTLNHGDSTEWFLRATASGTHMELLPQVLMYRRLHATNRSRLRASYSRDQYLQIIKADLDRRRRLTS